MVIWLWLCAALFVAAATYTDLRSMRIPNKLTVPAAIAGTALNGALFGLEGLRAAIIGLAGGFLLTLILHAVGALGAGDVKAFASLGAMLGAAGAAELLVYSLCYGAAAGVVMLGLRGKLRVMAGNVMYALIGLIIFRKWRHVRFSPSESALVFPFMIAVLPAFVTLAWINFG